MANNMASEEAYEEMIAALSQFESAVSENCAEMQSSAAECAENMQGDPAAAKASEVVGKHCNSILAQLEEVDKIIAALQQEIEKIKATAARSNSFE